MTRADWAKRPLREREIAAEVFCRGWGARIHDATITKVYALDLPDAPAQEPIPDYCPQIETPSMSPSSLPPYQPAQDDRVAIVATIEGDPFWPHDEGSIDEACYELVYGLTPGYRKLWLDILRVRLDKEAPPTGSKEG